MFLRSDSIKLRRGSRTLQMSLAGRYQPTGDHRPNKYEEVKDAIKENVAENVLPPGRIKTIIVVCGRC